MAVSRGAFSSKFGFILAAAGSAVGLGNIWGFPTQTANNGGAAFVFAYLILAFLLAYPAFMAELIVGRYGQANAITSLLKITRTEPQKKFAYFIGFGGIISASFILSFYGIIAGWMLSYAIEPMLLLSGFKESAAWVVEQGAIRNLIFTSLFLVVTVLIIRHGVEDGIEKWSKRLMPLLIFLLIFLIVYVLTLEGASEGVSVYLSPDFTRILEPNLLISALGQAFFSLSLGSSVMLIYGSYISKKENLVTLGAQVTLIDVSIAFLAGLLVIPAMYVAQAQGVAIFAEDGSLISGSGLVFTVLPAMFASMGSVGLYVAMAFFILMTVAALTSSISMLEGPVSYAVERLNLKRNKATVTIGFIVLLISTVIVFNISFLLDWVAIATTQYAQPLMAMFACVLVGWLWHRNEILTEIKQGFPEAENSLFWKIWPWYIKFICPTAIAVVFIHSL